MVVWPLLALIPEEILHLPPKGFGWWRSPVAYLHGVQGVAGSNPVHPTRIERERERRANLRTSFFFFARQGIPQERDGRPPNMRDPPDENRKRKGRRANLGESSGLFLFFFRQRISQVGRIASLLSPVGKRKGNDCQSLGSFFFSFPAVFAEKASGPIVIANFKSF